MVSIEVKGVKKALKKLNLKKKGIFNAADSAIKRSAFMVEGEVKESIAGRRAELRSVDTGLFKSSIHTFKKKPLEAEVRDGVSYGVFLEYGTSRGISPRRHFRNSLKRMEPKIKKEIENSIKLTR